MRVGYVQTYHPTVYFDTYFPGNVSYNYISNRLRISKGISDATSRDGDRKKPNPQNYGYNAQLNRTGRYRRYRKDGSVIGIDGVFPAALGSESTPTASATLANNQAVDRLYEKLRGSLDLSVDGFQSKQLKSMFHTWQAEVKNLMHIFIRIKRHPIKEASDLWIQYIYGVKPTLTSLHDAYMLAISPRKDYMKIVASGKDVVRFNGSQNSAIGASWKEQYDGYDSYRVRFDCRYNIAQDTLNSLGSISSLNLLSIGYELMTFSFVVDWFVDFGGYLRAYESALLHQTDFISGYQTITSRTVTNYRCNSQSKTDLYGLETVNYSGSYVRGRKIRSIMTGNPLPRLPTFSPKLGMHRTIAAAALLVQRAPYGKHADDIMDEFMKTHSRFSKGKWT